jgi:hypothetical protein
VELEIHRTDPQGQPQRVQVELRRGAPVRAVPPGPDARTPSAPDAEGEGGRSQQQQPEDSRVGASGRAAVQQGGLGITFSRNRRGIFIITALVPGGPAFASKMLQVRDALVSVDGYVVKDISGDALAARLVGPINTAVQLRVLRKEMREQVPDQEKSLDQTLGNSEQHAGQRSVIDVTLVREVLVRDAPAAPASAAAGSSSPSSRPLAGAPPSPAVAQQQPDALAAPAPVAPHTLIVDDGELWQMVLHTFGLLFQLDPASGVYKVTQKLLLPSPGATGAGGAGGRRGAGLDGVSLGHVLLSVNAISGMLAEARLCSCRRLLPSPLSRQDLLAAKGASA